MSDFETLSLPTGRLAERARGNDVCVLGFGISNRPLVHILHRLGARLTVYDQKPVAELGDEATQLVAAGVRFTTNMEEAFGVSPALIFFARACSLGTAAFSISRTSSSESTSQPGI